MGKETSGERIQIGNNLGLKLDLRPHDTYEENIDALERFDEFETVDETPPHIHPRVFHEVFKQAYREDLSPAKVDSEAIEDMKNILEENSEENHSWLNEKLFNLGYSKRVYGPENIGDIFENPSMDFRHDMIPDYKPVLFGNSYREGRQKRRGDLHYEFAANMIASELAGREVELE